MDVSHWPPSAPQARCEGSCTDVRASVTEGRTIPAEARSRWTSAENRAREDISAVVTEVIRPGLEDTTLKPWFHFFPLENLYFWTHSTRWDVMGPHLRFHLHLYPWGTLHLTPFNCLFSPAYNLALKFESQPPRNFQSIHSLPAGKELQVKFCLLCITYGRNSYFASNFNSLELKIKHRYMWSASVQGMNTQNIESKKYAAICSNRSGLWPTGQIDAFLPQNPFFSRHIRESFEVPGFSSIKCCSCCKSTLRQHKTLTIYNTRPCFSEKRCI